LEGQILRFYSKVFSIFLIFVVYFIYIFLIKEIVFKNEYLVIKKNQSYQSIIDYNIKDFSMNLYFFKTALRLMLLNDIKIHHGKFKINKNFNFIKLIKLITLPGNYYEKITIVEGWEKKELNNILKSNFKKFEELDYSEVIADTYLYSQNSSFVEFKSKLKIKYKELKNKYKDEKLLRKFTFKEILIIGSLLEKEGLDYEDKRKIYSVIINRLNKKMKLQIDATVIYAITEGYENFDRKLTYKDLKIKHIFNTYFIRGLPPEPISYVGNKTIELIFENYKTDYLFYFYNSLENKHIFSKNYKNHLIKLNEYRSK
jgi:UPF0755 protein